MARKLLWFVGLYMAGVAVVVGVGYGLRLVIGM